MEAEPPAAPESASLTWKEAIGCLFALVVCGVLLYGIVFGASPATGRATNAVSTATEAPFWLLARYGLCALLFGGLSRSLIKGDARRYWPYFRQIRTGMIAQNALVTALVVLIALGLRQTLPFLDRSWLYLLPFNDGKAINLILLPTTIKYVGFAFMPLLILNLPRWAHGEEVDYRQGTKDWTDGRRRSLRFGLAHCLVGVPLYVGLALAISGLWYTHQYFQGGVERSTTHHLADNLIIALLLLIYVASR